MKTSKNIYLASILLLSWIMTGCGQIQRNEGGLSYNPPSVELSSEDTHELFPDETLPTIIEKEETKGESVKETSTLSEEELKERATISETQEGIEKLAFNDYSNARLYILGYHNVEDSGFSRFRAVALNEDAKNSDWIGPGMITVDDNTLDDYRKQCFYVDKDVLYHTDRMAVFNGVAYGDGILDHTNFIWADNTPVEINYADSELKLSLINEGIYILQGAAVGRTPIVKMLAFSEDIWEEQKADDFIDIYLNIRKLGMDELFEYGNNVDIYDADKNSLISDELFYAGQLTFRTNKYITYNEAVELLNKIKYVSWVLEDGTYFMEEVLSLDEFEERN